jgi:hypothetical protein
LIYRLIYLSINLFIDSFIYRFIYLSIHSFIHSSYATCSFFILVSHQTSLLQFILCRRECVCMRFPTFHFLSIFFSLYFLLFFVLVGVFQHLSLFFADHRHTHRTGTTFTTTIHHVIQIRVVPPRTSGNDGKWSSMCPKKKKKKRMIVILCFLCFFQSELHLHHHHHHHHLQ